MFLDFKKMKNPPQDLRMPASCERGTCAHVRTANWPCVSLRAVAVRFRAKQEQPKRVQDFLPESPDQKLAHMYTGTSPPPRTLQ